MAYIRQKLFLKGVGNIKKNRAFAMVMLTFLLVMLTACGNSGYDTGTSANNQSDTNNTSKNADESTSSNNSAKSGDTSKANNKSSSDSQNGSTSSSGTSNENNQSSDNNGKNLINKRADAVLNATLKVESKKENTKVDYLSKTMTQNGKKVKFQIVPSSDHQDDFKEGFVKEVINNGDETHNVTLYEYKIDDNNKLSLIDTANNKIVYSTTIE